MQHVFGDVCVSKLFFIVEFAHHVPSYLYHICIRMSVIFGHRHNLSEAQSSIS